MYLIVVLGVLFMCDFSVFLFFHLPLESRQRAKKTKNTPEIFAFFAFFILPLYRNHDQIHNCFLVVVVVVVVLLVVVVVV